jgi:hypothetical protein
MLPPALLPELIARSTLPRYAHSALPDAPVRPERTRRRLGARAAAPLRLVGRSSLRRRPAAPLGSAAPLLSEPSAS